MCKSSTFKRTLKEKVRPKLGFSFTDPPFDPNTYAAFSTQVSNSLSSSKKDMKSFSKYNYVAHTKLSRGFRRLLVHKSYGLDCFLLLLCFLFWSLTVVVTTLLYRKELSEFIIMQHKGLQQHEVE